MLLTGSYPRSIDEKNRVAIPKPLREALGTAAAQGLYLAPGTDGSLLLYPEEMFEALAQRLAQASPTAREVRQYSRLFFAQAKHVPLDIQSRIRLPQELVDLVSLGKEVVLLGVQDHMELWDRQRWDDYLAERLVHYDAIAEAAFGGVPVFQGTPKLVEKPAPTRRPK